MTHPIATFPRYMYLNFWAFFLLFLSIGLGFLPAYRYGWVAIVCQVIAVFIVLKGAVNIFHSWEDKKRKYNVLMERNKEEFRADTFSEFMAAPCGRLLVKIVLHDLGIPDRYKPMRKANRHFWACKKENFRRQNVRVYVNPKYQQSDKGVGPDSKEED